MPIVYETSANLASEFVVLQWAENLLGEFLIRQGTEDLLGEFLIRQSAEDLPAEFWSRNASTVGETAAAGHDPILDPYQKSPFYAARRRWVFYSDGINLAFRSSTDGVTWSAKTMVRPCIRGDQFSIHFDGTYVHYAYTSGVPTTGHLYYCRGEPQSNGTITWSQVEQTVIKSSEPAETYSRPSVSVDSKGYPWIAYHYLYDDNGNPEHYVYAIKSQQNDGSFTGDPSPHRIDYVELETTARIIILPLRSEKMYCLWDKNDDVLGRLNPTGIYDDWDPDEDTGADIAAPGLFDAVSFLDHVHLVWTEKTTLKLQHRKRVYGTGWSASHEIYDAVLADMGPSISRGSQGKDPKFYVFWAPDEANPTADHVFYSLSTDDGVNWAAQVDWIDESADGFPLPNQQSVFEVQGEFYIGCVWVRSSPDDIRYYELEEEFANAFEDLAAEFEVGQGSEDLLGEFIIRREASVDLAAAFDGQTSVELLAEFIIRRETSVELLGEFIIRHEASVDLPCKFIVRHKSSVNLLAEFIIRKSSYAELEGEFVIRKSATQSLPGVFIIRHSFAGAPFCKFVVRHSDVLNLVARFIGQTSVDLLGVFTIRHSASVELPGEFIIRHTSTAILGNLYTKFAVRSVYPYWTDRRYINGVIDAAEALIGDAILEFIIEGAMDDIKVWADANTVGYGSWTNIDVTPTAIKRATTYGVVAALYARHTKTFQGQVIPTLAPVTVTVTGDQEKAMEHWEGKRKEMLELYLAAQGFERIWISTVDEEPVFTMEDIPPTITSEASWLEWLQARET